MAKVYVLITEQYRNGKRVEHLISTYAKMNDVIKEWESRCDNAINDALAQLDSKEISVSQDACEYVFDIHKSNHRTDWCICNWIESHKIF